jgi:twitching motility protein PilT
LRAALRQDPDVIVLGQMHDEEMVDTALYGVETGHLILTTLDSPDVHTTITRIVGMFPPIIQRVVRHRLADSLRAIVSQRLVPRADEKGRTVIAEVLTVTPEVRAIIADPNRLTELHDLMYDSAEHGMQTFDQHLLERLGAGTVSRDVALASATDPDGLLEQLDGSENSKRTQKSRKGASAGAS